MSAFWVPTQQILQSPDDPLVDKPRLTDKLLSKPPFRFLHDVITAVQEKTGFAPGLFVGQELDGHAIQDKEGKIAYLNKVMAVVSIVLNEPVPAKPLKVVAGLEPENTNIFLQMLGRAARMGPAASAVQSVLAGQGAAVDGSAQPAAAPNSLQQPPASPVKSTSGSRQTYSQAAGGAGEQAVPTQQLLQQVEAATLERPHSRRLSRDVSNRQQQEQQQQRHEDLLQPQPAQGFGAGDQHGQHKPAAPQQQQQQQQQQQPPVPELARPATSGSSRIMSAKKPPPVVATPGSSALRASSPQSTLGARPASGSRSSGRTPPSASDPNTQQQQPQPQLSRPPSAGLARPGSGSMKARDATALGSTNRILQNSPSSNRGHRGVQPLLGVDADSSSDEGDGPVQDLLAGQGPLGGLMGGAGGDLYPKAAAAAAGAQGALVKDILNAEEELRKAGADAAAGSGDQEQGSTGIILKRQAKPTGGSTGHKPRDLAALADSVQKLCQVALPLARSLEFLQEDVDSMGKEYRFWLTERRVYQERLQEEQRAAADTSELVAKVAEQDAAIKAAKARIRSLRSQLLQGEEQLGKLLNTVVGGAR